MYGNLTSTVTVRRRSALIVESAAAAQTLTVARQPVRASHLEVTVSGGALGTGEVTVSGLSEGATQTEMLPFSGPAVRQTSRLYTLVAGITSSGLHDESPAPTVSVRAVGRDGSAQHADGVIVSGWPAAIDDRPQPWRNHPGGGTTQDGEAQILLPWAEHWAPREGDLVEDEQGRTWFVLGSPPRAGSVGVEFWRLKVRRYEAAP